MNEKQYKLLKKGFLYLQKAHKTQNPKYLFYGSGIVESFQKFKDFNIIQKHIINEIGGL